MLFSILLLFDLTSCKKDEEDKQIAISFAGEPVAKSHVNFYVNKTLADVSWQFGDEEGLTSSALKPTHIFSKKGGYDVTVTGMYNGRRYTGQTWLYITDRETMAAKKYAAGISAWRNWHHIYDYLPAGSNPDIHTAGDTNFSFKMVNDSTLANEIVLTKWDDSTLHYQSVQTQPASFSFKYNFLENKITFTTGNTGMAGVEKHRYTSY